MSAGCSAPRAGERGPVDEGASVGPLDGVRILDLSALAPGPYATMLLGDLGADVVTVDPPPQTRPIGGLRDLRPYGTVRAREAGISPLFRSRRSLIVNLKVPSGRQVVLDLAARADVVIEGFRPGVADRLGIGYQAVREISPRVVYCSITGYGQQGPLAAQAGHDINYLAEAGLLSVLSRDGRPAGIPLNLVADFAAGGLIAAFGIVAALVARDRHGSGTFVDVSMYAGILSMLQPAASWMAVGAPDPSWGQGMLSGAAPFYDSYRTADDQFLVLGSVEPNHFTRLCAALGAVHLADMQADPNRWPELRAELQQIFSSDTQAGWISRLEPLAVSVSPVRTLTDALRTARERNVIDDQQRVAVPQMDRWACRPRPGPTRPGQHTRAVLREVGYDESLIDKLAAQNAVVEMSSGQATCAQSEGSGIQVE